MSDNIQPLRRKILYSDGEAIVRYRQACKLIRRLIDAGVRHGWEDGESLEDVIGDARKWLSDEELEREIFGIAVVPAVMRATGRITPDLTGLEHVCEFQLRIHAK